MMLSLEEVRALLRCCQWYEDLRLELDMFGGTFLNIPSRRNIDRHDRFLCRLKVPYDILEWLAHFAFETESKHCIDKYVRLVCLRSKFLIYRQLQLLALRQQSLSGILEVRPCIFDKRYARYLVQILAGLFRIAQRRFVAKVIQVSRGYQT